MRVSVLEMWGNPVPMAPLIFKFKTNCDCKKMKPTEGAEPNKQQNKETKRSQHTHTHTQREREQMKNKQKQNTARTTQESFDLKPNFCMQQKPRLAPS